MKDKIDPRMDPVLEECYRMKEEFAAQIQLRTRTLRLFEGRAKKNSKHSVGKYLPPPQPRNEDNKEI